MVIFGIIVMVLIMFSFFAFLGLLIVLDSRKSGSDANDFERARINLIIAEEELSRKKKRNKKDTKKIDEDDDEEELDEDYDDEDDED